MKKLVHFPDSCMDFFRDAVNRKQDSTLKSRLKLLDPSINLEYDNYEAEFRSKTIEKLKPNAFFDLYKDDLLSLYSYQSYIIRELRTRLSSLQTATIRNTCQNCTLIPIQSMDHILPKEMYPEFCINPLNLFPSCQTCNAYKSRSWTKGGKRLFLNLFLDDLPDEQYLFADIRHGKDGIDFKFKLKFSKSIDKSLASLIDSHYTLLHLLERMRLSSSAYLAEFRNTLVAARKRLTNKEVVQMVFEKTADDKVCYGTNYWKSILEESLVNDDTFLTKLK